MGRSAVVTLHQQQQGWLAAAGTEYLWLGVPALYVTIGCSWTNSKLMNFTSRLESCASNKDVI